MKLGLQEPILGQKRAPKGPKMKIFQIWSYHIDLNRILKLISDFDFVLRNFQFWPLGAPLALKQF